MVIASFLLAQLAVFTFRIADKQVPEAAWWRALKKGDEIQYADNPHATDISDIFKPNQIAFTVPGAILLLIGLLLWFLTVRVAWDGLVGSLRPGKVSNRVNPWTEHNPYATEDSPGTIGMVPLPGTHSERTVVTILLIGLGAVVFLAFRKWGQLRGNAKNSRNRD